MDETKQHGDAFNYYYELGADRMYVSVACQFNVSSRTVQRWSKAFNWKLRVVQRDLDINKRVEQKTNTQIVNTKADYRAGIKTKLASLEVINQRYEKLIADATEAIESGEIKIHDVNELDRVTSSLKKVYDLDKDYINLDLKLIGEDIPDRSDLNIVLKLPEDWNIDDIV